jgi:diadenosine tetraphosphate (Ap4A) HIT family hydrolase
MIQLTAIHRFVAAAEAGELDRVILRLKSGWAVMGESQVQPGYCLLYSDPVVPHLNALEGPARAQFLSDMATLGDAVLEVTGATRINYEMLGNQEPALHAHVIPRFDNEPEELRTKPIWFYDWDAAPTFSREAHGDLQEAIRNHLLRLSGPHDLA